ncbi:MAG: hypothetical protein PHP82_04345 [Candidatus ainarchaeum sp.]|nr:hypothetical protein [Candidatus ainarchaeum sp.]
MKKFGEEHSKSFLSKLKWLDPFTYVDLFVMPKVKKVSNSKIVEGVVNIFFAALFAIIIYSVIGFIFGNNTPLVIVYSESMEPDFYRGDIIGLTGLNNQMNFGKEINLNQKINNIPTINFAEPIYSNNSLEKIVFSNGEELFLDNISNNATIVYPAFPSNIPIIHRTIVKINALDGQFVLTKGDNQKTNPTFDQDCGQIDQLRNSSEKICITFYAIPIEQVQGVKFFKIPFIGCAKIWVFDNLISLITTGELPKDFKGFC